jgi:molybdate transport system substrate-binding protein
VPLRECGRPTSRLMASFGQLATLVQFIAKGAAVLLLASLAGAARAERIEFFAAASTLAAAEEIANVYGAENAVEVRVTVAASSRLARLIENGAPADIFLSANEGWTSYLDDRGLIDRNSRRDLLGNRLVLAGRDGAGIAAEGTVADQILATIASKRFVMGDPAHVPAGIYARQALEKMGLWRGLQLQAVFARSARDSLRFLTRAEVDTGFIYESDLEGRSGLEAIVIVPGTMHEAIRYPVIIVAGRARPAVAGFFDYLAGDTAAKVFVRHGFRHLPSDPGDRE